MIPLRKAELQETVEELREDILLLRSVLRSMEPGALEERELRALLRLSDCLEQRGDDLAVLLKAHR